MEMQPALILQADDTSSKTGSNDGYLEFFLVLNSYIQFKEIPQ